jgi:hypothetical protein
VVAVMAVMAVVVAMGTAAVAVQGYPQDGPDEQEPVDPQVVRARQPPERGAVAHGQPGERLAAAHEVAAAPVGARAAAGPPSMVPPMVVAVRVVMAAVSVPGQGHTQAGSDDQDAVRWAVVQARQSDQRDVVAGGDSAQRLAGADDVHDQLPAVAAAMMVPAMVVGVARPPGHPQDGADPKDAVGLEMVHPSQPSQAGVIAAGDPGQGVARPHRVMGRGGRRRYERQGGEA